eukprot:SAG31_NODE_9803_length_1225_cov_1.129663_2_plen_199_part_00
MGGRKQAALHNGRAARQSEQHSSLLVMAAVRLCLMSLPLSPAPGTHVQLPGGAGGSGGSGVGGAGGSGGGGGGGGALFGEVITTNNDACGPRTADSSEVVIVGIFSRNTALYAWHPVVAAPSSGRVTAVHAPRPGTLERFNVTVACVKRLLMSSTAAADRPHAVWFSWTGKVFAYVSHAVMLQPLPCPQFGVYAVSFV